MSDQKTADKDLDFSLVLASSVHDMKNSLGMLLNSLEEVIAHAPPADKAQKQRFSTLQYEASRINSELIQLLTIYRLQHHNLPFRLDENYVIETLEDQVARNDMLFNTIALSIDCDPDLSWYYDGELIGNVIHNVLINAARYAQSKIQVSVSVDDQWLAIHIEDDGQGFPEFMINAEPLSASEGNECGPNSTQLGLFFAAKIASFHRQRQAQGRIALANGGTLGGGVFSIYLP
ncbi:MAG: sensor histidine kinase [Cellvibrionaceae bacterium]|nr:sensor histidine kinase [Cellvibrionaceae bacterium]